MSTRLQAVREARGLSRAKVAARIGSSEQQLMRWEKGVTPVQMWHLAALALVYEVPIDELQNSDEEAA